MAIYEGIDYGNYGTTSWMGRYYKRYRSDFESAGLTPASIDEFASGIDQNNFEGSYLGNYGKKVYEKLATDYNAEARKYGKLTGIQQDLMPTSYSYNINDLPGIFNNLKAQKENLSGKASQY